MLEHGVFSCSLIQAFDSIEVDSNNNGIVSIKELFEYSCNVVEEHYEKYPPPSPQNPAMHNSDEHEIDLYKIFSQK